MSIIGITAEYNPFHLGHEYQIKAVRERFGEDSTVVCIMSGDFVQRGEAAVFSKFARAQAACLCGADIVAELPAPWALSSAEGFARGAVGLMKELEVDIISFGSESGDTDALEEIAAVLCTEELNELVKRALSAEPALSYAAARQSVLEKLIGEKAALIARPNDLLGVEYLKAIKSLDADIRPFAVKRLGSGHDERGDGFKSSSELREIISAGKSVSGLIPDSAYEIYKHEAELGRVIDAERLDSAVMSRFRMLSRDDFNALPDAADGVGDRLYRAAAAEPTVASVIAASSTKRYAVSRIRRMAMCAALGITDGMANGVPPYARVLAANGKGCVLLRDINSAENSCVVTKPARVKTLGGDAERLFSVGARAHDIYAISYVQKEHRYGGNDWKTGPFIVK